SHATVSRALNNPEKVKPETLEKIRAVFAELDFNPKVIPNSFKTVCLLVPDSDPLAETSPIGNLLITNQLMNILMQHDYQTIVTPASKVDDMPEIYRKRFVGFIRDDSPQEYVETVNRLSDNAVVVMINDTTEKLNDSIINISSAHAQGTKLALEHFCERGHKKIGFVSDHLKNKGLSERFDAYKKFMEQNSKFNHSCYCVNEYQMKQGLKRICDAGITSLLVGYTHLTEEVVYRIQDMGLKIPDDISVISFGFSTVESFKYPPLSHTVQPVDKLAEKAVEICLSRDNNSKTKYRKTILVPYTFKDCESVKYI
ncbi:MAG: LacI family DNA-binding transcriptional regulator, partial [Planctomycetota bacterium]